MPSLSFRWFAKRFVPGREPCKQAVLGVALVLVAGCGGDGEAGERVVRGNGYSFAAPADWSVQRTMRELRVSDGVQLLSVTRFSLLRGFRPGLWDHVVPELDRAATEVAEQQNGEVTEKSNVVVDGRRARRYDIAYEHDGDELVERLAFVLRGKIEYLLLCRYERGGGTDACDRLFATFRLA